MAISRVVAVTVVCSVCIVLSSCAESRDKPERYSPLTKSTVLRWFQEPSVLFHNTTPNFDKDRIYRWRSPAKYRIFLDKGAYGLLAIKKKVELAFNQASRLTGVSFEIAAPDQKPAFVFYFTKPGNYEKALDSFLRKLKIDRKKFNEHGCFSYSDFDSEYNIIYNYSVISTVADEGKLNQCIYLTLANALGVPHNYQVWPAQVGDDGSYEWAPVTEFPEEIRLFLRVLYDEKIQPGMSHAEAAKIAEEIISGL